MLQPHDCVALATALGGSLALHVDAARFTLTLPVRVQSGRDSGSSAGSGDAEVRVALDAVAGGPHWLRQGAPSPPALAAESPEGPSPRRLGRVSDFIPVLPPFPPSARSPEHADVPVVARTPRRRVLIVDDEAMTGKLAARAASRADWDVEVLLDAADLPWGQASTLHERCDLVLLDIVMKRSNGVDACRRLRGAGCRVRIIAMTSNTGLDDVVLYKAVGFDGLLGKPFGADQLRHVLAGGGGWG